MISGQFLNITPFFAAIFRPLFRGHSIAHESSYVPLIETRRQKKPLDASTRNGEVKARARYVRVVERQHLVPPFPPSSHRIIPLFPSHPFYPCPVSFRLFSISPPFSLSLAPSIHSAATFLLLYRSRPCPHSGSGRCRCPDVTSVTMSFNTRR